MQRPIQRDNVSETKYLRGKTGVGSATKLYYMTLTQLLVQGVPDNRLGERREVNSCCTYDDGLLPKQSKCLKAAMALDNSSHPGCGKPAKDPRAKRIPSHRLSLDRVIPARPAPASVPSRNVTTLVCSANAVGPPC